MTLKKEQITFSANALLAYASSAIASKELKSTFVKKLIDQMAEFFEKMDTGELSEQEGAILLNKFIDRLNAKLPDFPQHATYPHFRFESLMNTVSTSILGFEHYLHSQASSNRLTSEAEMALFDRAVALWKDVMGEFIAPQSAMSKLSSMIHQVNKDLPKGIAYPLPIPNRY